MLPINPNVPPQDGDHFRWNEDNGWADPVPAASIGNVRMEFSGAPYADQIMVRGTLDKQIEPSGKTMADIKRIDTLYAHAVVSGIAATRTRYTAPCFIGAPGSVEYTMPILQPGTVKNFYIRQIGSQPGTGTLECHVRHNAETDGISIIIPEEAVGPVTWSNTEDSFHVEAGDFIGFKFVNNAGALSATLGFIAVQVEYD